MKTYTAPFIWHRARRIQDRALAAGALFGCAFIGFALTDRPPQAMAMAILGATAIGISIGAWIVAARLR